ncbi:cytochrome c [Vibrio sp. T187]|uniref:c-type cytochrome n=1 Tax=Vibrio TaxID=662 RepID=UPI0010C94583|nr:MULTISPECIES: cytochrome c [Vibrio]MBW3698186.1 cytochrome c [Vibrio sp. T187]
MKNSELTLSLVLTTVASPIFSTSVFANAYEAEISQRQTAFSSIEDDLKSASRLLDGKSTDWEALTAVSRELIEHGNTLNESFPEGSQKGSKAKKEVWTSPSKFNTLLAQMDAGFEALYNASAQQDPKQASAGIKQAEKTCKSCHRSYRSRW